MLYFSGYEILLSCDFERDLPVEFAMIMQINHVVLLIRLQSPEGRPAPLPFV